MKNLTNFRKTVETGVDPRLQTFPSTKVNVEKTAANFKGTILAHILERSERPNYVNII